jgi:two-component system response regulator FixJ
MGDKLVIESQIIHLIDDDREICHSLEFLLNLEGYKVYIYNSARSFLDMIKQIETGCILTDVRMPEMNGIDFLATLNERGVFMPTIVMSGLPDAELEIKARKLGAVEYFEKPYDPDILLAAIRKVFTKSHRPVAYAPIRPIETARKGRGTPSHEADRR